MNKVFNTVLWVILFILLLPSSLAIASWNSLPGSRLFTTKLFMEQALVFLIPSTQVKGDLQIAYTERRFSEAKRLLSDKTSVQGLSYLDSQVDVTKDQILKAKDPVVKQQLAQKYVAKLREVNTQLEEQKQIAQSALAPAVSTATPTPVPTRTPTPTPATPTRETTAPRLSTPTPTSTPMPTPTPFIPPPSAAPSTNDVVSQIDQTQDKIDKVIHDIEKETEEHENRGRNENRGRGSERD